MFLLILSHVQGKRLWTKSIIIFILQSFWRLLMEIVLLSMNDLDSLIRDSNCWIARPSIMLHLWKDWLFKGFANEDNGWESCISLDSLQRFEHSSILSVKLLAQGACSFETTNSLTYHDFFHDLLTFSMILGETVWFAFFKPFVNFFVNI